MSILTRVLIVFTVLMSIVFMGYNMALYNARTNHEKEAIAVKEKLEIVKNKLKGEEQKSKSANISANNEISRLNRLNVDRISSDANYLKTLADKDLSIRRLNAVIQTQSEDLTKAINISAEAHNRVTLIQEELKVEKKKSREASDQMNLLVDLAHTEEQMKIVYREQVKNLKIDLDNTQFNLQVQSNMVNNFQRKYGVLTKNIIPEINGKIVGVKDGVVVINQGKTAGVQNGFKFSISRGPNFIGKVVVKEVYADKCVGYVLKEYIQRDKQGREISVNKHDIVTTDNK
jgi:hypothetical protein